MSPRIDPALPLVWRSPHELQLGGEVPRVVLVDPGALETGLLAALRHGASRATLHTIGAGLDGTPAEVERLLARLAPAFEHDDAVAAEAGGGAAGACAAAGADAGAPAVPAVPAVPARRVLLDGEAAFGVLLERRLTELGYEVAAGGSADPATGADPGTAPPALVVIAAHWVVAPARHLPWLRADVPHLAVVDDEAGWRIGPLVTPGHGPCLRCLELERRDRDPAWPVIAAQLEGRPSPPAPRGIRTLVDAAAIAAGAVDDHLRTGATALTGRSVRLAAGDPQATEHPPHPECGCRAPAGTATAPARRVDRRRAAPSSVRAVVVPA